MTDIDRTGNKEEFFADKESILSLFDTMKSQRIFQLCKRKDKGTPQMDIYRIPREQKYNCKGNT
jgi:hypothetical protein